jgi:hypothetical protein
MIKPRRPVPELAFDTVAGGRWSLGEQTPKNLSMVVFYRGLHCPVCRKYTAELNGMIGDFDKRGISTVITSTDSRERAEQAKEQWGLPGLTVGYGVSIEKAREWGVHLDQPGNDLGGNRGAAAVRRARPVPRQARPHAVLGQHRDHAVRAAAFSGDCRRDRFRAVEELPGTRRSLIGT